jgi:hypothetical protein
VLLLGATGETGGSILTGLLDAGHFVRNFFFFSILYSQPNRIPKPEVKDLLKRGVRILIADISSPIEELVPLLHGVDIFISAISGMALLEQMGVVTAAKPAGVKRFVPCALATVCPAGGVMRLRDHISSSNRQSSMISILTRSTVLQKEEVLNHIKQLFLPFTFINVGYWYQFSFLPLPSGKTDKYLFPGTNSKMRGDGTVLNLITDLRDVGHFVARIVADERTLNQYVFAWGEEMTEKEIYSVMEQVSGEKLPVKFVRVPVYACKLLTQRRFQRKRLRMRSWMQEDYLRRSQKIRNFLGGWRARSMSIVSMFVWIIGASMHDILGIWMRGSCILICSQRSSGSLCKICWMGRCEGHIRVSNRSHENE